MTRRNQSTQWELTDHQKDVLAYVREHPGVGIPELTNVAPERGWSKSAVGRALQILVVSGNLSYVWGHKGKKVYRVRVRKPVTNGREHAKGT